MKSDIMGQMGLSGSCCGIAVLCDKPYVRLGREALPDKWLFDPGNQQQMIQKNSAERANGIGNRIRNFGFPKGDKRLVNLIADTVEKGGSHAKHHQQMDVVFDSQGLIGPVE